MLTTTCSFSARAARTSAAWPAWSAPMVGTRPTLAPCARQSMAWSRSSSGVPMVRSERTTLRRTAVTGLLRLGGGRVGLLGAGERALGHVLRVAAGGVLD